MILVAKKKKTKLARDQRSHYSDIGAKRFQDPHKICIHAFEGAVIQRDHLYIHLVGRPMMISHPG